MTPKRSRLKCPHLFTLMAVLFLLPVSAEAQTGRVAMQASVSEVVALSVGPNLTPDADVVSSGNTVRITLSGDETHSPVIRVPLLVRSNSGFKITAAVESTTTELAQMSITHVRATGALVSPQAVSALNVPKEFDPREQKEANSNPLNNSLPLLVVSGPRVSLGGTLKSPNNALEITVLVRLKSQPAHGGLVHLTFAATPEQRVQ